MKTQDLKLVELLSVGVLLIMLAACVAFPMGFSWASMLLGGAIGIFNLQTLRVLLGSLVSGGPVSGLTVFLLIGKFVAVMATILVAGLWFEADILALAVGFSSVVIGIMLYGIGFIVRLGRQG